MKLKVPVILISLFILACSNRQYPNSGKSFDLKSFMDLGSEMQSGEISRFTCFASQEPAPAEAGVTRHLSLLIPF